MTDDPITDEWLKSVGFKWHQFDRQPGKLWLGGGLKEKPCLTSYEDIGIELASKHYQTARRNLMKSHTQMIVRAMPPAVISESPGCSHGRGP